MMRALPILVLALVPILLEGCGRRPTVLDPPPGATQTFPRTYPNPKYDPPPQPRP